MENQDIFSALEDLTTDDEITGNRRKLLSDFNPDEQKILHSYIIGEKKLPDSFFQGEPSAEEVIPPNGDTLPEEIIPPEIIPPVEKKIPVDKPVARPPESKRDLEIAQGTLQRASARKAAYDVKRNEIKTVLNIASPDRTLDPEAWDVWNENRVEALRKQGELAIEYAEARDTEDIESNQRFISNQNFTETVESIGDEFDALKLPKPFWELNSEYEKWLNSAISLSGQSSRDVAFNRFKNDPEFAKQVGAMPDGSDKLFVYLNALELQKKIGGDFEGAVLKQARSSGIFKTQVENARSEGVREAAKKNDEALHRRQNEKRPSSVQGGGGGTPQAPVRPRDQETARAWLKDWQGRVTAETYKPTKSERERDEAWTAEAQNWLSGENNSTAPLRIR